jgi:hypothetical protein
MWVEEEFETRMNWAGAIEVNHQALARIVAGLIAVVGLTGGGLVARLPEPLYRAVLVMLRPTEAAVRRLIVIAARGLKVKLPPSRSMPEGRVIARSKSSGRLAFQLFDSRKRFDWVPNVPESEPGRHGLAARPLLPRLAASPVPKEPDGTVDATRLSRRILALKQALDSLPKQAKRMACWKARRARMASPKFTSPLRPGRPPGLRKRRMDEIDFVLKECHGLAREMGQ